MSPRGVEVRPGEGGEVGVRRAYAATRIVTGVLFACHGSTVLFGWPHAPVHGGPVRMGAWPGWWAALIELGTGLLVAVGWRSRPAGLLASGSMAFAYFTVHQSHGLFPLQNGGESAAIYSWVFLLIAVVGSGEWSLESALHARRPVTYVYSGTPGPRRAAIPAGAPAPGPAPGIGPKSTPELVTGAAGSAATSASPGGGGSAGDAGRGVGVIPPGVAGPGNGGRPAPGRALRRERKRRRASAATSVAAAVGRDRATDAVLTTAGTPR